MLQLMINLTFALGVCGLLYWLQTKHVSFTKRVFIGLVFGVILGDAFQTVYQLGSPIIADTNSYLDVIGTGYVKLMQN